MTTDCPALPARERTLPDMLRRAADRFGDRPLLAIAGASWTHREAADAAARRAGALRTAIEIAGELPRTENGKVQKYKLRERGIGPATWERPPRA